MTVLTTAVVLLAVVTALHVLLTFGLVTRIRELQQQVAGMPAKDPDLPRFGQVVAPFSVTDLDGDPISEADLAGPVQVGFFAAGCAPCTTMSDWLAKEPPATRFIALIDGDPAADNTKRLIAKLSPLGRVALIDPEHTSVLAFAITSFPTLLHLDSGVVTASGSRPSHFTGTPLPVA
ncbi:TlpA family protein disulfide reductase [Actinophytocola sp. NPDC049390]|uniref:TlpA family protein disulfide reductase n=1 Tax=Actinophytocola sp. NPDC049390 TaxID=3363894 RepID=UPI003798FE31